MILGPSVSISGSSSLADQISCHCEVVPHGGKLASLISCRVLQQCVFPFLWWRLVGGQL